MHSSNQNDLGSSSKPKKSEALWLLSFTDLCMILISFFIMMLSYASVDKKKAEIVSESMKTTPTKTYPDNLIAIQKKLNEAIKKLKLDDSAKVTLDTLGLSVELNDALVFSVASSDTNAQFKSTADKVMKLIAEAPTKYNLLFEGHTDDQPINSPKFASNWELSSSRGIAMLRMFEKKGVAPHRMSVVAYADTKPKLSPKDLSGIKLEQARLQNRRVVIRIH